MKVEIGTKFRKQLSSKKYVNCEVYDIYEIISISQKTGSTSSRLVYYAISEDFGMGQAFEVAKTTILRNLI